MEKEKTKKKHKNLKLTLRPLSEYDFFERFNSGSRVILVGSDVSSIKKPEFDLNQFLSRH